MQADYFRRILCTRRTGRQKLVYCTDIIKQYPEYPIFEGEKYVSLGYKYQLIDQDYPYWP